MNRFSIILSYNGSEFSGWQIQNNSTSVQEVLQNALSIAFREEIKVSGAGRTDTGVNAINYIAHFEVSDNDIVTDTSALICKINAILPKTIKVHGISPVPEDFHARFSATSREYHYFVHLKKDPFMGQFSHHCKFPLDIGKMNRAAEMMLGRHDFSCFEKSGGNNVTSICTVTYAAWEAYTPTHLSVLGYPAEPGDYIVFTIRADRFLRNMVRAVVGTLLDIGRGRKEAEWMEELIKSGTRSDAGQSVPGNALFLSKVKY